MKNPAWRTGLTARPFRLEKHQYPEDPDTLKTIPIFDTNIFGDVQRRLISPEQWKQILHHRRGRGWPLSSVTALELLVGIDAARPEDFPDVRQRISTAYNLSNGRVLEDPRYMMCRDLLNIPAPEITLPSFSETVELYMDVTRRATSLNQLMTGVPYKGGKRKLDTTRVLGELMAGPKKTWAATTEQIADEKYPQWRELFGRTGKRLPPELRRELKQRSAWEPQRPTFVKALLEWLNAPTSPQAIAELSTRLDAALDFTIFVVREFLLTSYSLTQHDSDVFDFFQLQHLAFDKYVIVSSDPDLVKRTRDSPQASRILTFDQFLETLRS